MMLKRIKSSTDMVHFLANINTPMSVKGFVLRIIGVSAGTAVVLNDVGRIFLRRRGDVRVSADFDALQIIDDMEYGYPMRTGAGGIGAYAFSCYIPRTLPGSKDVEYIEPDDNYQIEVAFGPSIAAHSSGFLCELYADIDVGVCWYDLQILQTNFAYAAATTASETVQGENLVASYLTAELGGVLKTIALGSSNITELTVQWGNQIGTGLLGAWLDLTTLRKRFEWTWGPAGVIQYGLGCCLHTAEGEISGALEDSLGIQFTVSAAAYPIVLTMGMKFNQDKLIITRALDGTLLANKLAEKDRAGHSQASAVIKTALGQQ